MAQNNSNTTTTIWGEETKFDDMWEKKVAIQLALKRSKNPDADRLMYWEFIELPLNKFRKVCEFRDGDWMTFAEAQEKLPSRETFVASKNLDFNLFRAMLVCAVENAKKNEEEDE
jgi:hypothetical protein